MYSLCAGPDVALYPSCLQGARSYSQQSRGSGSSQFMVTTVTNPTQLFSLFEPQLMPCPLNPRFPFPLRLSSGKQCVFLVFFSLSFHLNYGLFSTLSPCPIMPVLVPRASVLVYLENCSHHSTTSLPLPPPEIDTSYYPVLTILIDKDTEAKVCQSPG